MTKSLHDIWLWHFGTKKQFYKKAKEQGHNDNEIINFVFYHKKGKTKHDLDKWLNTEYGLFGEIS